MHSELLRQDGYTYFPFNLGPRTQARFEDWVWLEISFQIVGLHCGKRLKIEYLSNFVEITLIILTSSVKILLCIHLTEANEQEAGQYSNRVPFRYQQCVNNEGLAIRICFEGFDPK